MVVELLRSCLLYTSDAADEGLGVDLGGRRIIKKKNQPFDRPVGLADAFGSKDEEEE